MAKKSKRVKYSPVPPSGKSIRVPSDIHTIDQQTFKWRVNDNYIDYDHQDWGWNKVGIQEFFQELLHRLHDYESMTWADLLNRRSCHYMPIEKIVNEAQRRLSQRCLDIENLVQIDMKQPCRLWGYRDRQILYLIWHDPQHTVYQVQR